MAELNQVLYFEILNLGFVLDLVLGIWNLPPDFSRTILKGPDGWKIFPFKKFYESASACGDVGHIVPLSCFLYGHVRIAAADDRQGV